MKREDAKEAILREWMDLAPEDRATDTHARLFAISKAGEYRFRSKEDRADVIAARTPNGASGRLRDALDRACRMPVLR
jgi:hypothetical protein